MAIPIKKFGQRLLLTVKDEGGRTVFSADDLRIDFDIRNIDNLARAKFSIYNLEANTVKQLLAANMYVDLEVALHDGELVKIAGDMYISNAINVTKVPDGITSLFCYSGIRQRFMEQTVQLDLLNPTIEQMIKEVLRGGWYKYTGSIKLVGFPKEGFTGTKTIPPFDNAVYEIDDHVYTVMEKFGKWYNFKVHYLNDGSGVELIYKVNSNNVKQTGIFDDEPTSLGMAPRGSNTILLDTNNMRANPRIGLADLVIVSNLDPRIKPGTVLDISNLITATPSLTQKQLELASGILSQKTPGQKYQVLNMQHKGSNWTGDWHTQARGFSENGGTTMSDTMWWK